MVKPRRTPNYCI